MAGEVKKSGKMTVFRSDRHEDMAAMVLVGCLVVAVLCYMAFIVPTVTVGAPSDGKIVSIAVSESGMVQKGEPLYTFEVKEKKWTQGKVEEKLVTRDIKSAASGKVLKVVAKPGDELKKGKPIVVLEHEKGTLP
ncbi:MAG TPA: biotin/lipoyl-binding protein [Solidesulfovibrio magneticus]|nr:biotin/lipoyl-binding protein [Solidesulfovibrio magneticus]